MSARASGYMKALVVCPNGELITPREKLVGMVLADSHQDKARRFTYPSVETIAEESRSDRRTCQRYLDALERKGVIRRLRPSNQGRGAQVFYFFPALDELPEGWQDAALLSQAAPDVFFWKGRRKGGGRAAEGRQGRHRAYRTRAGTGTKATRTRTTPPYPPRDRGGRRGGGKRCRQDGRKRR